MSNLQLEEDGGDWPPLSIINLAWRRSVFLSLLPVSSLGIPGVVSVVQQLPQPFPFPFLWSCLPPCDVFSPFPTFPLYGLEGRRAMVAPRRRPTTWQWHNYECLYSQTMPDAASTPVCGLRYALCSVFFRFALFCRRVVRIYSKKRVSPFFLEYGMIWHCYCIVFTLRPFFLFLFFCSPLLLVSLSNYLFCRIMYVFVLFCILSAHMSHHILYYQHK